MRAMLQLVAVVNVRVNLCDHPKMRSGCSTLGAASSSSTV